MFDKLKQLNELRKMKNAMRGGNGGVGKKRREGENQRRFYRERYFHSPEAMNGDLAKNLKNCFNDAVGKCK